MEFQVTTRFKIYLFFGALVLWSLSSPLFTVGEPMYVAIFLFLFALLIFGRESAERLFHPGNAYAFDPDGYNDEDPLRGLVPKFDLVDPSKPIARNDQGKPDPTQPC